MQKFPLGRVVATPAALRELEAASVNPLELIGRHVQLDPGCLDADDRRANDRALVDGSRLFSAFVLASGSKVWVITESDRFSTCILLPNEY